MNTAYRNLVAEAGATAVTHIGLVNGSGTEISGGDPAYARKAVGWDAASDGTINLDDDYVFDVPEGATVAGWRGYSASTDGTDYGGATFASPETFGNQGTFTLNSNGTYIAHDVS